MWCEVILPRNKVKGEITERYFYQTLSLFFWGKIESKYKQVEQKIGFSSILQSFLFHIFFVHGNNYK